MSAIFKREFRAYFKTPLGYIFLAAFYLYEGIFYSALYKTGASDITSVIFVTEILLIFIVPLLTMRAISEDRRQKVDQVLLTSPISVTSMVLGKAFAALAVVALGYAPTLVFAVITAANIKVNWAIYFYAVLGIMLLAATLISIGVFISSLTESPTVAAILTIVANLFVMLLKTFAELTGIDFVINASENLAFMDRIENFSNGVLSIPDIVYFFGIAFLFIFLTVRSVEKRRWA